MMEGNKDIFLAGDDGLGYLARPMYKKNSITFIWGHSFSTCGSYDRLFDASHISPCAHMYTFRVPPPFYVCDLINLTPPLPFCSFAIVSSYCLTSKIQNSFASS